MFALRVHRIQRKFTFNSQNLNSGKTPSPALSFPPNHQEMIA